MPRRRWLKDMMGSGDENVFLSENSITFTHVDEARKANLHAYKRITIRPAIYE